MKVIKLYMSRQIQKKRMIRMFFPVILIVILSSCTEEIDLTLDESYTRLVVEGAITTDTTPHTIKLTTTTSYFYSEKAPVVENAILSISDGINNYPLMEAYPGTYQTAPDVFGVPGRTYKLNIQLVSPIGGYSVYEASSHLHDVNELDSVTMEFHPEWTSEGIWEVKCFVQEPPTKDYYRFMIYKNNKIFTPNVRYWFVIEDKYFNGSYANGAPVSYFNQGDPYEKLNAGDTIGVEVNRITKEYYDFILQVQSEVLGSYPLFSGPPANVKGNISNGAIGFFAAYDRTIKSTITPLF